MRLIRVIAGWVVFATAAMSSPGEVRHAGVATGQASPGTSLAAAGLRVESQDNPIGIATERPKFSWTLTARTPTARGLLQSSYRLLVASSPSLLAAGTGDVWDSEEQASERYFQIEYSGTALQSHTVYYWKVQVADEAHRRSSWSRAASFTTALLHQGEWKARWIAEEIDRPTVAASDNVDNLKDVAKTLPIFRHAFVLDRPVKQALVFVTGLGQYELRINGKNVTDTVLNPGWTDYRKSVLYSTYDATRLLRRGENVFGVLLGNGMYNVPGVKGRYTKFIGSFGQPKLILQMQVTFADGSERTVVSDGSWKTEAGPITYSSIYGGEDYDARRVERGWDRAGFRDDSWKSALEVNGPGGELSGKIALPIKVAQRFAPIKVTEPQTGVIVYDLGQNASGWPSIAVQGRRGETIRLTAGELLDEDGRVTQKSAHALPDSANVFSYTLRGGGVEHWSPRFSYYGFRYVEVEGASRRPSSGRDKAVILAVTSEFVHDAVERSGQFSASNVLFNRIHKLIDMAILSNMVSVLTDCPHREKLGWLEQTHLAGASIMLNYGVDELYRKMADDMRDSQLNDGLVPSIAPEYVAFVDGNGESNAFRDSPEWGSAVILSPWVAYQFYGDRQVLVEHYGEMKRYLAYLKSKSRDHLLDYGLGDWYDVGPKPPGESQLTSKSVTATATYYQDLSAMVKIASLLGKGADASGYEVEMRAVKAAFNAMLFHAESNFYDRDSQTANAMPLVLGLVPEGKKTAVLDNLVADIRSHQNRVTAGDIGFHYVVRALSDGGRSDVLYEMLSRTESPSYGYQLTQGATTLTEAWDTNPESSQNHFMLGHGEEWFYRGLAGIDLDMSRAAPEQIVIRPQMVGEITKVHASYDSVLGRIASSWEQGGAVRRMRISIPVGSVATIYFPARDGSLVHERGKVLQEVAGISGVRDESGSVVAIAGSGEYEFTIGEGSSALR